MDVSMQISTLYGFVANARRIDVSKFKFHEENQVILRLQPQKLIFSLFSKIKGFMRGQFTSNYLST